MSMSNSAVALTVWTSVQVPSGLTRKTTPFTSNRPLSLASTTVGYQPVPTSSNW